MQPLRYKNRLTGITTDDNGTHKTPGLYNVYGLLSSLSQDTRLNRGEYETVIVNAPEPAEDVWDETTGIVTITNVVVPPLTPEEQEAARQNGKSADHKRAENIYVAVKAKHCMPNDMDPTDVIAAILASSNVKDQVEALASAINLLRAAATESTRIDPLKDAIQQEDITP